MITESVEHMTFRGKPITLHGLDIKEFADGRVAATADANRATATSSSVKPVVAEPKTSTPKRVAKPAGQGSLF